MITNIIIIHSYNLWNVFVFVIMIYFKHQYYAIIYIYIYIYIYNIYIYIYNLMNEIIIRMQSIIYSYLIYSYTSILNRFY